jgi:glucokinase
LTLSFGLDIGGTKILGVVLDQEDPRRVLAERRVPTPAGADELLAALVESVTALTGSVGRPASVGVGIPGLVDHQGVLHFGPHLPGIIDFPIADRLAEAVGVAVVADNDANCAALAEQRVGAAFGVDDALVVTFGTGIGAGVVVGGRLLEGAAGFAGEVGHMVVEAAGPPCPCGRRGCWERFASGTGLSRLARDAALAGQMELVVEMAGGDPEEVRGEHVTDAARQGDPGALDVLAEFAEWVARGLANLANVLDPGVIVLGGGVVGAADLLLDRVRETFSERLMASERRPVIPIVPAALGARAGAIGAALLPTARIAER